MAQQTLLQKLEVSINKSDKVQVALYEVIKLLYENSDAVEGTAYADIISEFTVGTGVTVDGVLIKDGRIASIINELITDIGTTYSSAGTLSGTDTIIQALTKLNGNIIELLTRDKTFIGIKTFDSFPIAPSNLPTTDWQLANKAYVDTKASGLIPKESVKAATVTTLPACTYTGSGVGGYLEADSNDAILPNIDDVTLIVTNRVLIKNENSPITNGIYTVDTVGEVGVSKWKLIRATDYDSTAEVVSGTFMLIEGGTVNANKWYAQLTIAPTLDTDSLNFGIVKLPTA